MLSRIAKRITDWLQLQNYIVQEEYEICVFGIEQLISSAINLVSILLIGIVLDTLLESIIFLMAFKLIRECAGGYHASTRVRCYLLSIFTVIVVLSVIKYISIDSIILLIMSMLASIIIILFSPVDTENKRIDAIERIYYRRKSMIILWVELLIAGLCVMVHFNKGTKCIVFALFVLAMALVGEKIKNIKKIN